MISGAGKGLPLCWEVLTLLRGGSQDPVGAPGAAARPQRRRGVPSCRCHQHGGRCS